MDKQVKESHECLRSEQRDVDKRVKLIETGIETTETLLRRSPSAEIVQLQKSLNTMFKEDIIDGEDQVDSDLEGFRRFIFVENDSLMAKSVTEGIGAFKTFISKTSAHQSSAQGKGTSGAIVGLEIGGEGSFTFPYHCVQHDNHLIVSDRYEHCIKVHDRDGKLFTNLESRGRGTGS